MTDELLYERLAISIAQLQSPLPRVHGDLIPNVSQLYPLLLAPVFRHGARAGLAARRARPERVRDGVGGSCRRSSSRGP
jgi:hypothetical protein